MMFHWLGLGFNVWDSWFNEGNNLTTNKWSTMIIKLSLKQTRIKNKQFCEILVWSTGWFWPNALANLSIADVRLRSWNFASYFLGWWTSSRYKNRYVSCLKVGRNWDVLGCSCSTRTKWKRRFWALKLGCEQWTEMLCGLKLVKARLGFIYLGS